jgi:hypothetical protein
MPDVRDMKSVWSGYGAAALPLKKCPNCGVETRTQLARCPECNRRYDRRLPWLNDRMRWALGAAGVVAFIVGCILILPGVFDSRDAHNARVAAEERARVRAEIARLVREQRPVHGRGIPEPRNGTAVKRLTARKNLVGALETAIFEETSKRLRSGELKGSLLRAECGPLIRTPGRAPDHEVLARPVGRYDCVAVQSEVIKDGERVGSFGHPFVGAIHFRTGRFTLCKDNKAQSERAKSLAQVRLKPECLGLPADAEPLGNGYVIPEY